MGELKQIERQWRMALLMVQGNWLDRRSMAARFGVDRKTINRDFDDLSRVLQVAERVGEGGVKEYGLTEEMRLPGIWLEPEEADAIRMAADGALRGTLPREASEALRGVSRKVEWACREGLFNSAEGYGRFYRMVMHGARVDRSRVDELMQGCVEQRVLRMSYRSVARPDAVLRDVEPFELRHSPEGLHLLAFCRLRGELRVFNVSRIESLEVLDDVFERREEFDTEVFWGETFGMMRDLDESVEVILRIHEPTARWAGLMHYSVDEVIEELEGGGVDIRFRTRGLQGVMRRVMFIGPDCEVVAPVELGRRVRRELSGAWRLAGAEAGDKVGRSAGETGDG